MKRKIAYIFCLFLLLAGCDNLILELPEGEGVDPSLVNFNLNLAVDPAMEPYVPSGKASDSEGNVTEHDVRWIVEIFRDEIDGEPESSCVLTCDPAPDGNHRYNTSFDVHAGKYVIVAWADYVDDGSVADKYYNVSSLSQISIAAPEDYIGNEEHKDTYVAVEEVDLTGYRDKWNSTADHSITLQRPMAKIEFITTDVEKMLDNLAKLYNSSRHDANARLSDALLSANPDLGTIEIKVEYAGYLPSGFNVYTDKPNDAVLGMSFSSSLEQLSDEEARLGSDYVFVNGNESAVMVNLVISDNEGNLINRVAGIEVPIARGKLTTVKDEFLTKDYAPGIGIDPGFDGEIDIVIPE